MSQQILRICILSLVCVSHLAATNLAKNVPVVIPMSKIYLLMRAQQDQAYLIVRPQPGECAINIPAHDLQYITNERIYPSSRVEVVHNFVNALKGCCAWWSKEKLD